MKNPYLEIATIVKTFGIKGELKLISSSDQLYDRLTSNIPIYLGENHLQVDITSVRVHQGDCLITINKLNNINLVLEYVNQKLYINRNEINDQISDDQIDDQEYYFDDLIGLKVINQFNQELGEVIDVLEIPSSFILEIKTADWLLKENAKPIIYIPFVDAFIKEVNETSIIIEEIEGFR